MSINHFNHELLSSISGCECSITQEPLNPHEPQEPQQPLEPLESQKPQEPKEPQEPQAPQEPLEPQEPNEPQEPLEPQSAEDIFSTQPFCPEKVYLHNYIYLKLFKETYHMQYR